jgi:hypothetical protein
VVDLGVGEARRMEVRTRVGEVQMTFCDSVEVRRMTSGLTEENRVVGERAQLKESMVERCNPVVAILEVHLVVEVDRIQDVEEGKD